MLSGYGSPGNFSRERGSPATLHFLMLTGYSLRRTSVSGIPVHRKDVFEVHSMTVSRLHGMAGIGVDRIGELANLANDPSILRMENLDTDIRPPAGVVEATQRAAALDESNSYLPFLGAGELRRAAAGLVSRLSGVKYDWKTSTIVCAGGLNGMLNVMLAVIDPGDEVILPDPIYIGLINRVRLAGGIPVFLPYRVEGDIWVLDRQQLKKVITPRTRMFLMMSPSMPAGAVFSREDWEAVCVACRNVGAWMLYDSAMERILFDNTPHYHPASFEDMANRTITVGAVSKEYRMIGWRVGWIVAPPEILNDIGLVSLSNVVCPVGIAQAAAVVALRAPDSEVAAAALKWQRRRDVVLQELAGFPIVKPQGGWSLLMDVSSFGLSGAEASRRLLDRGKIAVTPMTGWGTQRSDNFVRLVFSNEPVHRLLGLRQRVNAALESSRTGSP
jgi:aspartate/methionine/tyrosine aminotransferase